MSTSNRKRPQGVTRIAARIRGYFDRALDQLEKKGKSLDQIIYEELLKDFKGTMSALARYVPAEIDATIEDNRTPKEMTDKELLALIAQQQQTQKDKQEKEARH